MSKKSESVEKDAGKENNELQKNRKFSKCRKGLYHGQVVNDVPSYNTHTLTHKW